MQIDLARAEEVRYLGSRTIPAVPHVAISHGDEESVTATGGAPVLAGQRP
jgi:hypothetical protein